MTGTFGGALEAREIPAGDRRLTSDVVGEVEKEDGVLVIRRIHVRYHLKVPGGMEEAAQRAYDAHPPYCPVYRTVSGCIDVTTELDLELV
ncbi:MAG: OsmC family protein [Akkermansiaceae bacterium]|nr:OsmC family protein [Akkermansiaceae bacterium]